MAKRKELALTFDGSYEGFLCVVYAYYYDWIAPLSIQAEDDYQQVLDADEYYVATDFQKAARVQAGIRRKISAQAENYLTYAFLASGEARYMDMFRYVLLGFNTGAGVDSHLQKDYVLGVHKRARYVGREAHLLSGFCRFAETNQGVFYCDISPVNNVLPILAEHFQDRMMNQAWIIHDKKRHQAAIYNSSQYMIGDVPKLAQVEYSSKEQQIQDMWRAFFSAVTIKERTNKTLQRNLLPLHFRKFMTEFSRQSD